MKDDKKIKLVHNSGIIIIKLSATEIKSIYRL